MKAALEIAVGSFVKLTSKSFSSAQLLWSRWNTVWGNLTNNWENYK